MLKILGALNADSFLVTFFSKIVNIKTLTYQKVYFVSDASESISKLILNLFQSFIVFIKERPNIIISTGAGVTIPIMMIGKLFLRKIIFIELSCQINNPSKSGRIAYYFADKFYIQHRTLLKFYPNATLVERYPE